MCVCVCVWNVHGVGEAIAERGEVVEETLKMGGELLIRNAKWIARLTAIGCHTS